MNIILSKGYIIQVHFTSLEFYKSWHLSRRMWFLSMLYDWIPTVQWLGLGVSHIYYSEQWQNQGSPKTHTNTINQLCPLTTSIRILSVQSVRRQFFCNCKTNKKIIWSRERSKIPYRLKIYMEFNIYITKLNISEF